ncbi:hypothetical protein HanRHA438_Chr13g0584961 [Helianthus annuus]|nr:hypothetical protein HanRHA438_Chr13g0584961 [Helianthus annuus]
MWGSCPGGLKVESCEERTVAPVQTDNNMPTAGFLLVTWVIKGQRPNQMI